MIFAHTITTDARITPALQECLHVEPFGAGTRVCGTRLNEIFAIKGYRFLQCPKDGALYVVEDRRSARSLASMWGGE